MSLITVLGSSGFIGSHLVKRIRDLGIQCLAPAREESLAGRQLGSLIYAIGVTADFRTKPFETVQAHVCKFREVLQSCKFDSVLYLSSTRLYHGRAGVAREDDPITTSPLNPDHLYNISKLMGESIALASGVNVRVVRLSNVYGEDFKSDNFLTSVIRDAVIEGKVALQTSADSAKDYVSLKDVVEVLINIAKSGRERIYNVASGSNVSNHEITEKIRLLTGCEVEIPPSAPKHAFPLINVDRVAHEFGFKPSRMLDDLDHLVELYKAQFNRVVTKPSDSQHSIM